jgi:hypothetical protein
MHIKVKGGHVIIRREVVLRVSGVVLFELHAEVWAVGACRSLKSSERPSVILPTVNEL